MKNEKTDGRDLTASGSGASSPYGSVGGFEYAVSDEAIREHRTLSAWDKLRWLRQANAFIARFASKKTKLLHERFRSGAL